ncbi:hypothetical protein, partial [Klebsiella pneumoniae]|uniref:hypothetical protein n=1 Tax=Klebsiella pneumoniae TaxID=573 RepID=UPI00272FC60D
NLSVAGTTQLVGNVQSNGQIRVGTTTSNGIIAFSLADKTNIRGNINGALVITGYGGNSAGSNAIHIRPSGDTMSNSGEIIIQRDGTIVAPKAQLTSLSVSGDSQQNT